MILESDLIWQTEQHTASFCTRSDRLNNATAPHHTCGPCLSNIASPRHTNTRHPPHMPMSGRGDATPCAPACCSQFPHRICHEAAMLAHRSIRETGLAHIDQASWEARPGRHTWSHKQLPVATAHSNAARTGWVAQRPHSALSPADKHPTRLQPHTLITAASHLQDATHQPDGEQGPAGQQQGPLHSPEHPYVVTRQLLSHHGPVRSSQTTRFRQELTGGCAPQQRSQQGLLQTAPLSAHPGCCCWQAGPQRE